jgi:hypothetical protein
MNIPKRVFSSLAFLCLALSTIHASELLYTLGSNNIVKVYSVNSTTAATKMIGSVKLPSSYGAQIVRTANTPFLYAFGFNPSNQEFLWTYKLNASGVPGAAPIQTLPVKNALRTFVILPNGKFAYGMYSWEMTDPNTGNPGYAGDAVLFTINTKTGLLTNTKKPVVNFPLNDYYSPELVGMNTKGTEMYTVQNPVFGGEDAYYLHSSVNPTNGAVTGTNYFWQDDYPAGAGVTGIGNLYMAEQWPDSGTGKNAINIYLNAVGPNILIHCDEYMVQVCGDTDGNMVFDPTGKYLLFDDSTISEVPILYVSAANTDLVASGASIPGNAYLVTFSPTGLLLYGWESGEVLVYVFNPHTGLLTAKSTIADLFPTQLLPIK